MNNEKKKISLADEACVLKVTIEQVKEMALKNGMNEDRLVRMLYDLQQCNRDNFIVWEKERMMLMTERGQQYDHKQEQSSDVSSDK